jgi:hypothetical protein
MLHVILLQQETIGKVQQKRTEAEEEENIKRTSFGNFQSKSVGRCEYITGKLPG